MSVDWVPISNEEELERLVHSDDASHFNLILKHSSRCMISTMAKNRLERKPLDQISYYIIDVISHRSTSNTLSKVTGVRHESPQCFLFWGSELVEVQSHGAIDVSDLRGKVTNHSAPPA